MLSVLAIKSLRHIAKIAQRFSLDRRLALERRQMSRSILRTILRRRIQPPGWIPCLLHLVNPGLSLRLFTLLEQRCICYFL